MVTKHACPYFMTEANRHVLQAHSQYVACNLWQTMTQR